MTAKMMMTEEEQHTSATAHAKDEKNEEQAEQQQQEQYDGVAMHASRIQNAGSGLFVTRRHAQGSVLCEYTGDILPNAVAWKLADKSYLMKLGEGKYVDALHCPNVLARYINDCRGRLGGYNVTFEKRPREDKALVVALRDIEEGEELFVDYGRFYWVAYNLLHPESPVN